MVMQLYVLMLTDTGTGRSRGGWSVYAAVQTMRSAEFSQQQCIWSSRGDQCHFVLLSLILIPKANSAFHPSGVGKWVPASAGKAKAGMVPSVSGWTRGVQVKLWDPLRVPYLSALEVCSRRGAIQIHVYLYLYLYLEYQLWNIMPQYSPIISKLYIRTRDPCVLVWSMNRLFPFSARWTHGLF